MTTHFSLPRVLHHTPLLIRSLLAYASIVGGVAVGSLVMPQNTHNSLPLASSYTPPTVAKGEARYVVQGTPTRITVDRLHINLPIQPGIYDAKTGEWTLSDTSAYFATITDEPNDYQGSTFIYGHNRQSVFAPLVDIKPSDKVIIHTENGRLFTYNYVRDASITPDITTILYEHPSPPQLVLMTCEGIWSSTRRIMYFTLTEVS